MKSSIRIHYFSIIALMGMAVCLLPSCKRKNVSATGLRPLTSYIDYQATKQGVTVCVKQLSAQDCKPLLGNRASLLWKKRRRRKPIIPIQLSITNQTNNLVALQPDDVDLKLTDYNTVASRLHRNSCMQAFGELLAGLVITGTLVAASALAFSASGILLVVLGSVKAFAPAALLGSSALLITPFFLVVGTPIISTIKVVKTSRENNLIKKELKENSLKHALIIEPHKTVDTLIFVSNQNYQQEFTITIRDPKNAQNRIPFPVKLMKLQ